MERLKRPVYTYHHRRSAGKAKEKEKEREEMTLCLFECLQAAGLQHHYSRFTSMGVCCAAHLSALTMEDYPLLGISTMEDRTRLFHLVQLVKTDLRSLVCEDDDEDYGDEGYTAVTSSYSYDRDEYVYSDNDDDEVDDSDTYVKHTTAAHVAKPSSVRRRLDFSCENTDQRQNLFTSPKDPVHTYASQNRRLGPVHSKMSSIPLQLGFDNKRAVVCGSKRNNDHHAGGNAKKDTIGATSLYHCHIRYSSNCDSSHKQTPRPATGTSKRLNKKTVGPKDRRRISRLCKETGSNGVFGHMDKPTPVYEAKGTAGYNYGLPQSSSPALIRKQAGGQRISVCVRKRPLTHAESRRGEADIVTTPGGDCVIIHESKEAVDLTQYILQHRFYFDQVFGEESSNEDVYQRTAYPLVQHMLNGGKATCFAYGQTGAGKTHTMLGSSPGRPGLYALAVRDIFAHLSTARTQTPLLVYVSFFEIYCGQLYDLLDHRKRLFAREDGQKVVHIAGIHEVRADSVSSLLEVISQGMGERTQGMTGVNPLSSRSHALLQIQLRGLNQQIVGRMWFVDLAGSERASDTKEPDRLSRMEGAEINQSLLALKECIRSLDQEQTHTPFRQSKLTQVLKDSFVGDSMTCMIANISPGHMATEHTLNTLRYADRVKELRRQRELRGGTRGKTAPAPKHNLSNSSSSTVGTRGKSPPKKAKLGKQKESPGPTSRTTSLPMGEAILCSTPKNRRWREESSPQGSKEIGFEYITPVRGWMGTADKRERVKKAGKQVVREAQNERTDSHSVRCLQGRAGPVLGRPPEIKECRKAHLSLRGVSGSRRETMKVEQGEERNLLEHRNRADSNSGETCKETEIHNESVFKKADDKDKDKKKHLRWYHQQLQQFVPSSAPSSVDVFSPFQCSSLSSSNQASLSSCVSPTSCSSLQQPSRLSLSALMHHGFEEVLDEYRAQDQVKAVNNRGNLPFLNGESCMQPGTSLNISNDNVQGGLSSVGNDWRQLWEQAGAETRIGQGVSESERSSSVKAKSEARALQENKKTAGMDGGKRRMAWGATTETQHADMTGVGTVEAQVSYNCESHDRRDVDRDGLNVSDVPADGLWSAEEGGEADGSVSSHSSRLQITSSFGSPDRRAPAERPFSPWCEHTSPLPTRKKLGDISFQLKHAKFKDLPLHSIQQATSSGCHIEKTAGPVSELSEKNVGDKSKMKVEEDDVPCLETLREVVENEEPLMELPQVQNQCSLTSKTVTAVDFTKQRKDTSCATCEGCPIGREKHHTPDVMLVSVTDQANTQKPKTMQATEVQGHKAHARLPTHSTYASMQMCVKQSIKPSVQYSGNTDSSYPHIVTPNDATQMPPQHGRSMKSKPASSISTQQSENAVGHLNIAPSQCHTVRDEEILLNLDNPTESHGQESINNVRPVIHLSTLEDMNHAQWCVVRAHWEQLEEMESLCHKEGMLLCQQPDMAFREYINKLEKIMERKAQCVHSMRAQLQPYLSPSHSSQSHNQGEHNNNETL